MPKKKNTASSLNKEKFLIIGAGNMGIAVIRSLFNHRISSKKIVVIEKNQSSELKKLKRSNNFEIKNSIDKINNLYQPTITLIAVKPNQLKTLNGLDKDNRPLKENPLKDGRSDHGMDSIRLFFVTHYPIKNMQMKVVSR